MVCAVVAVALHLMGAAILPIALRPSPHEPLEQDAKTSDSDSDSDDEPMVLRTISEEELAEILKDPEELEEPEPEPEPEDPVVPPTVEDPLQPTVSQVNNMEAPSDAKFVSDNANKVEEETVAEDTTFIEALPGDSVPEDVAEAETTDPDTENVEGDDAPESPDAPPEPPTEIAMAVKPPTEAPPTPSESFGPISESWEPATPEPDAPGEQEPAERASDSPVIKKNQPKGPPGKMSPQQMARLFNPSISEVEKMYADDPVGEVRPTRRRRRILSRHSERQRQIKASLENMISEVKPGNHTSVNANKAVYAGYIGAIHRRIHARWANEYLPMLDTRQTFDQNLSNPTLMTKLEFVIDAESGLFEAVNIVSSSGVLSFDAEAIDTAWSVGQRPNAPAAIVSPNGKVYVHWSFWRDGRQCGVFGASVFLVDKDGGRLKTRSPGEPEHDHPPGHRH